MKKMILGTVMASLFAGPLWAEKPQADIAILIDTSGSMSSLIAQVRDGLWQTLNGLSKLKKDGKDAELRLALYEYGSGVVSQEANFIQMLTPLTTDHTVVAEKLFATLAKGGTEYSGMAIQMAAIDLKWAENNEAFRSIVIAGNETINQGPVDPLVSAVEAKSKDILVNSIFAGAQTITTFPGGGFGGGFGHCRGFFCPNPTPNPVPTPAPDPEVKPNPIFLEWKAMAEAGGGEALNIDHNQSLPYIESPFDKEIVELTEEVNKTFLPFGENGSTQYQRMIDLDRQVRSSGAGSYMSWGGYRDGNFGGATQANWDLVTASENEEFDLAAVADEHLPKEMQGMSLDEKLAHIAKFAQKRKELEKKIAELKQKRKEFVDQAIADLGDQGEQDFSAAIKEILVKQLKAKGFELQ